MTRSTLWVLVLAAAAIAVVAVPAGAQSTQDQNESRTVIGHLDRTTSVLEVGATESGEWYIELDAERRTELELVDCMVGLKHDGAKCNVVEERVGEGRQRVTMDAVDVDGKMYVCAYTPRTGKAGWCAPADTGGFSLPEPEPWHGVAITWAMFLAYIVAVTWYYTRGRGAVAVEEVEPKEPLT